MECYSPPMTDEVGRGRKGEIAISDRAVNSQRVAANNKTRRTAEAETAATAEAAEARFEDLPDEAIAEALARLPVTELARVHRVTGRARCAREGLNATLTASALDMRTFCYALRKWDPMFNETDFKLEDGVEVGRREVDLVLLCRLRRALLARQFLLDGSIEVHRV